jgi:hypothetical protein
MGGGYHNRPQAAWLCRLVDFEGQWLADALLGQGNPEEMGVYSRLASSGLAEVERKAWLDG